MMLPNRGRVFSSKLGTVAPVNSSDRAKIEKQLEEDMARAMADFSNIERATRKILLDASAGIPLSYGKLRLVQSGQRAKLAFQKYEEILKQYREFLAQSTDERDEQ